MRYIAVLFRLGIYTPLSRVWPRTAAESNISLSLSLSFSIHAVTSYSCRLTRVHTVDTCGYMYVLCSVRWTNCLGSTPIGAPAPPPSRTDGVLGPLENKKERKEKKRKKKTLETRKGYAGGPQHGNRKRHWSGRQSGDFFLSSGITRSRD